MTDDAGDLLYVPAHPVSGQPGAQSFAIEPRTMPDGPLAAIAFTSVESLVGQLGHFQPWVAMTPESLHAICAAADIQRAFVDPKVYPFEPRWTATDVDRLWAD